MDKIDALEKLYNCGFEAGKNIIFWDALYEHFAAQDARWTLIVLVTSAIAFGMSIVAVLPETVDGIRRAWWRFRGHQGHADIAWPVWFMNCKLAFLWVGIFVAFVPTYFAFYLTEDNPAKKATSCAQSSSRWHDVGEQVEHLRDAILTLKTNEPTPEPIVRQIVALDSKVDRVEDAELKDNDEWIKQALQNAYDQQIRNTYGVEPDAVAKLKQDQPLEWAKSRFGFIPDHQTLERILGKPLKDAQAPSGTLQATARN